MIRQLKNRIGTALLKRKMKNFHRERAIFNFDRSKQIGVIFEADKVSDFETIRNFLLYLNDKGNQVFTIGYIDQKKIPDFFLLKKGYNFICKKDLNFFSIPETTVVRDFLTKPFDILIDLSLNKTFPLHYMSSLSKAKFKIGTVKNTNSAYDFMIDVQKNKSLDFLVENIKNYTELLTKK
jgi:hypothetical protein